MREWKACNSLLDVTGFPYCRLIQSQLCALRAPGFWGGKLNACFDWTRFKISVVFLSRGCTFMLLMYTLCLPVNKPSPNNRPHNGYKDAPKKLRQNCRLFCLVLSGIKNSLKNSLFISFLLSIYWAQRVVQIRPVRVVRRRLGVLKRTRSASYK